MQPGRSQILGGLLAAVMVWVTASALFGDDGLVHWLRLRGERARIGDETMRLARETRALEQRIAALAEGRDLETLAREQFGLVRPDEVVYRFRRPPKAGQ